MNTRNLKLNDFEAFDRLIFRGREPNWKCLYDPKTDAFYPPIPRPKSEAEHQLDHYALWMVIAHNDLTNKPCLFLRRGFRTRDVLVPRGRCYACQYHAQHYNIANCHNPEYSCPLTSSNGMNSCGEEWNRWNCARSRFHFDAREVSQAAIDIAHINWREIV